MQIENIIINEYLENNSFITTKQAESMGISRHILSLMAKDKRIKRFYCKIWCITKIKTSNI